MLSSDVSTIVFYVNNLANGTENIYGIADDLTSYIRSDDLGMTWQAVSPTEFSTVGDKFINNFIYKLAFNK